MTTATKILNTARSYLGVTQGSSAHLAILAKYNAFTPLPQGYKVKATDDWCDVFVSVMGIEAGATDLIGRECGVQRHIDIFKNLGIWYEDGSISPLPGDIICYNWDDGTQPNDGWADHIGYVESVSGGTITTIEGNTSRMVKRRTIPVGYGYIRGFARPKYSSGSDSTPTPGKSVAEIAQEVLNGKWGNDPTRSQKLNAAGYDAEKVRAEVNRMYNASTPAPAPTVTWRAETGTFKPNQNINLRESPSTKGKLIATIGRGVPIKYNAYAYNGGFVWIRQPRANGKYGYMATGEAVGNKRKNYWGTFY